jgi:hypothetical protein
MIETPETMTPERIDVDGRQQPSAHFGICAITLAQKAGITFPDAVGRGYLNVCLTIDGKQVPFTETIAEIYARMESQIDLEAAIKAYQTATLKGLDKLQAAIEESDWKIRERIEEAFGVELPRR